MKRVFFLLTLVSLLGASLEAQTGTWSLFGDASQGVVYHATVQQPINPGGDSVFIANRGVVPVKFTLASGPGSKVTAYSIDGNTYGGVEFTPSSTLLLSDIRSLVATFTISGSCGGGSPRFSIDVGAGQHVFVYLGATPNFTDCTADASSVELLGLNDSRVDTSQLGGKFYDTWANAVANYGSSVVQGIALVVDGGWLTQQTITITQIQIGSNIYNPPTSLSPTCTLPDATIDIFKNGATTPLSIDEVAYNIPADTGSNFRVSSCQYVYNLSARALGAGTYSVYVNISPGGDLDDPGKFALK